MDRFFRVSWADKDTAIIPNSYKDFQTEDEARAFISKLSGAHLVTLDRVADFIDARIYTRLEI